MMHCEKLMYVIFIYYSTLGQIYCQLRTRLSQSHGPHNCPTPTPALSRFSSFWRPSQPHGTTERDTQSQSQPISWTRSLVSGILRRRDGSDIQLRKVEVPYTAGKPVRFFCSFLFFATDSFTQRNYHARKKPVASSSRPSNTHTLQQNSAATQSIPQSSQQSPPAAITSTLSAVPGTATAMGTNLRPRITIDPGWRARFMLWVCCMPIQHTDGQH
jgi:hypothetical protein